jgi:hypothetical protein
MYGNESGAFAAGQIFGVILAAIIAVFVAKDANSRGMSGIGWGIFTFFLCIIALPIYLVIRKPKVDGGG